MFFGSKDFTSVTRADAIPGMSTMESSPSSTSMISRTFFFSSSSDFVTRKPIDIAFSAPIFSSSYRLEPDGAFALIATWPFTRRPSASSTISRHAPITFPRSCM